MSVRTDVVNLQLNVKGDKAQNELNELRKRAADIKHEMSGLKKSTQEYINKKAELAQVNAQMADLKKTIGLTSLTQKELVSELNRLKALKGSVIPFSKEFKDLQKEIKAVENRLYDVRNGVQGFSSFMSKISDEVKQFGMMAAGYLGFQFLSTQFQNILSAGGKLSDQLADLRRITGMNAEEVKNLNSQLSGLETRTSTGALREIAIVAGKLGVAKDDILGFVESMDMLTVALGDELGSADQISETLGKILNVFDGGVNADNIAKLGNAFVELANAGVASGAFIADFDQRLSGIAKSAGIGLGELSGLGAGLEELGARVESSATAVQKIIVKIGSDLPQAAQIAGMEVDKFKTLYELDPTEALLRYSEGLVKNKNNFAEVIAAFSEVDESGARTIETITKLGESSDLMRTRIKQGAEAIKETDAITAAYELKNETLGASLDKLGKEFNRLIASEGLRNFLIGAVEGALSFIQTLKQIPKFINENSTALKLLVAGLVLLNVGYLKSAWAIIKHNGALLLNSLALKGNTLSVRANALALVLSQTAMGAYIIITQLLTRQITLATAAQRLWALSLSIGLGPLGVLITVVGAAVIAFNMISKSMQKFNAEQTALSNVATRAAEAFADQGRKVRALMQVLTASTSSLDEKKEAYKRLIAIHPDFANTLKIDEDGHVSGTEAIDKYIDALRRKSEAQAAEELASETYKEILRLQQKITQEKIQSHEYNWLGQQVMTEEWKQLKQLQQLKKEYDGMVSTNLKNEITDAAKANDTKADGIEQQIGLIAELQRKIKELDEARPNLTTEKSIKENLALRKKYQDELDRLEGRTPKKEKDTEGDRLRKEAEEFKKMLQKMQRDAELGRLSADQREIQQVEDKYQELLQRAKKYWAENTTQGKQAIAQIIALRDEELNQIFNKQFERNSTKEYEESLTNLSNFFDEQKRMYGMQYANGLITKKEYEAKLAEIEASETETRLMIAKDYENTSKKASEDVAKFFEVWEKFKTARAIEETEKRKALTEQEQRAGARLDVLKSKKGSKEELDAKKREKQLEFELETEHLDKTSNLYLLKKQQLDDELAKMDEDFRNDQIDEWLKYINLLIDAFTGLNQILSNLENRELAKDKKRNEQKKNGYKKQLDGKLISQAQYDKEIKRLEEEQDKREKEIKLRQAKRQKAIALFEAITGTAAAIVKALPNLFLAAIAGAMGAIQIGTIASSPLPEMGTGGLLRNGPKHRDKDKGLHVVNPITGKTEMLLERDEAVLSANAMKSRKRMTVSGTPSQIASALNSSHGGKSWDYGAVIDMQPYWSKQDTTQISGKVVQMMATGGVTGQIAQRSIEAGDRLTEIRMVENEAVSAEIKAMREDIKSWQGSLKSYVVLKDIDETKRNYEAAKNASGLKSKHG